MLRVWETANRAMRLYITITCKGKCSFHCMAEDAAQSAVNSKYARRTIDVEGTRTIFFSFPVTPKQMTIGIINAHSPQDKNFQVEIVEKPLVKYNIWMDGETGRFLDLLLPFSQMAGFKSASENGRDFKTSDGEFCIKYFPVIKDFQTGQVLNTPASIGHQSGIINNSKAKFDKYTQPMRVIIDLHEFSHKYKNPKMGLPISNEKGADINALYIYMGLGFSKVDAIYVFANVFLKAQTPGNIERMRLIQDYIHRFENEEFAEVA